MRLSLSKFKRIGRVVGFASGAEGPRGASVSLLSEDVLETQPG